MKALVIPRFNQCEIRDIPPPEPGPCEALVKIEACGVCSTTDREIIKGTLPFHKDYPCVLGHEAVGLVVETGAKVRSFRKGDRVTRPVSIWPGERRADLASGWGGFAEYGIVRDRQALADAGDARWLLDYTAQRQNVAPDDVSAEHAVLAIALAETASCLAGLPTLGGKSVCIAGTGIAGLSLALWCKLAGAHKVIVLGRRQERLDAARAIAADSGVLSSAPDASAQVKDLTGGGADVFLEASGDRSVLRLGLACLKSGGMAGIYGVTSDLSYDLDWNALPSDVRIARLAVEEHKAYGWACEALRRGWIPAKLLLTHRWPLAEHSRAFSDIAGGKVVKGLITM